MKVQLKSEATKEQRHLQRIEYALRLARNHNKGMAYLTEDGLKKIAEIVYQQ